MSEYHESWEALDDRTKDYHRALQSLQEELEAVDWYQQRMAVTGDGELREILAHNRDEEMEHAAMLIEWLRRHMSGWHDELTTYLFSDASITGAEEGGGADEESSEASGEGLGIGGMKGER